MKVNEIDTHRDLAAAQEELSLKSQLEQANGKLKTLQGTLLTSGVTDDGVTLDHANTCGTQVVCANGVLHQIDAVLMPSKTQAAKPAVGQKAG